MRTKKGSSLFKAAAAAAKENLQRKRLLSSRTRILLEREKKALFHSSVPGEGRKEGSSLLTAGNAKDGVSAASSAFMAF